MTAANALGHVENSIETAQAVLDHAQKVVTQLDAVHDRAARLASTLRQATFGLLAGGALLVGMLALRHHRER